MQAIFRIAGDQYVIQAHPDLVRIPREAKRAAGWIIRNLAIRKLHAAVDYFDPEPDAPGEGASLEKHVIARILQLYPALEYDVLEPDIGIRAQNHRAGST